MWVNAEIFMKLVEKVTSLEHQLKRAEEDIETLKKRPIVVEAKNESASSEDMMKLYNELTQGIKDEKAGRVIYTDGRD